MGQSTFPHRAVAAAVCIPEVNMKRIDIDKPAATPQPQPAAQAALDTGQAAWQEAWSQQLNRTAEIYGKLFATMRDEVSTFVQKRIEADMEIARRWNTCSNMTEVLDLQQKWLQGAVEHYTEQSLKMAEICQKAVSEPAQLPIPAEPAHPSAAGERQIPAERKAPSEHAEPGVSRAA